MFWGLPSLALRGFAPQVLTGVLATHSCTDVLGHSVAEALLCNMLSLALRVCPPSSDRCFGPLFGSGPPLQHVVLGSKCVELPLAKEMSKLLSFKKKPK